MKKEPKSKNTKSKSATAIRMLKEQHREVKALFKSFARATNAQNLDEAKKTADQICLKLILHATLEEEFFYPAAQSQKTEEILSEAAIEHISAKRLIADIQNTHATDKKIKALVTVLQEQVEHHVKEEEGTLFPESRKVIPASTMIALAKQMEQRLKELTSPAATNANHDTSTSTRRSLANRRSPSRTARTD